MKTAIFAINDLSFGGGQRTVVEEADDLSRAGYNVFVLTLLNKPAEPVFLLSLKIPPENIVNIPFRSFADFTAFKKLIRFLRQTRPDVVFSNLFFTNTLVRLAKLFLLSPMRVFIREGNLPVEKSLAVKIVDCFLSLLTEKIIVNAAAIKSAFKKLWISQKKIVVLYNGIDEKFFEPFSFSDRVSIRQALGLRSNDIILICIASLSDKKGHTYLLEAFNHLAQKNDRVVLLLVGDGSQRDNIQLLITNYQLQDRVKILGARQDVKELLGASDIFVLGSLWEGMPNAMLEAMAMGLPVVVTDVGGINEVIDNGKNGLVVQPKNANGLALAIKELIANPMLRAELGGAARQSVMSWTWKSHLQGLIKLIET